MWNLLEGFVNMVGGSGVLSKCVTVSLMPKSEVSPSV